jgi:hypothetical protein
MSLIVPNLRQAFPRYVYHRATCLPRRVGVRLRETMLVAMARDLGFIWSRSAAASDWTNGSSSMVE